MSMSTLMCGSNGPKENTLFRDSSLFLGKIRDHLSNSLTEINKLLSIIKAKNKQNEPLNEVALEIKKEIDEPAEKPIFLKPRKDLFDIRNNCPTNDLPNTEKSSLPNDTADKLVDTNLYDIQTVTLIENPNKTENNDITNQEKNNFQLLTDSKEQNIKYQVPSCLTSEGFSHKTIFEGQTSNEGNTSKPHIYLSNINTSVTSPKKKLSEEFNCLSHMIPFVVLEDLKYLSSSLSADEVRSVIKFISCLPIETTSNLDNLITCLNASNLLPPGITRNISKENNCSKRSRSPSPKSETTRKKSKPCESPASFKSTHNNISNEAAQFRESKISSSNAEESFKDINNESSCDHPVYSVFNSCGRTYRVSILLHTRIDVKQLTEMLNNAGVSNILDVVIDSNFHNSQAIVTLGDYNNFNKSLSLSGVLKISGKELRIREQQVSFWKGNSKEQEKSKQSKRRSK